ncbi:Cache 3/Cache 2 fusion domain-containing protein [Natroniella sp. ANB-PHB2]|uniref:Cache 3/Cache 2 fusion domain-containing protein n=1 Tax=Natroniella sp. ANB-PHB2 TaxID=3384444 RepID=UPI0038D47066
MKKTIRKKLLYWLLLVAVIPALIIGSFSYYLISQQISRSSKQTLTNTNDGIYNMVDTQQRVITSWLKSAGKSFENRLEALGKNKFDYDEMVEIEGFEDYKLPTWYIGEQKITGDFTLVDELIQQEKLPASIFMFHKDEFIRVSTNVRDENGRRIMGTILDRGTIFQKLINGQQYIGRANVEGIMHATIYKPIKNKKGDLVGAFVIGRKEQEYELINNIKNISIENSGYSYVIDSNGKVVVHPEISGENVYKYDWIKEMINSKEGSINYEFEGENKVGYYKYYEPWDWYIVTQGLEEDIFSSRTYLYKMFIVIMVLTVLGSLLAALFISKEFSKPIKKFVAAFQEAKKGNLNTKYVNVINTEEFDFLSKAYNAMMFSISMMIGKIKSNSSDIKKSTQKLTIDVERAKGALEKMECNINSAQNDLCFDSGSHAITISENDFIIKRIYKLFEKHRDNFDDESWLKIEAILKLLYNPKQEDYIDLNEKDDRFDQYKERNLFLNDLNIELEKVKLLLDNIDDSTEDLYEIALYLEKKVAVFDIDDNPFD